MKSSVIDLDHMNREELERIGQRIRGARVSVGLNQRDAAKMIGITQAHLSNIESGTLKNPTIGTLKKVCEALSVPIGSLIYGAVDAFAGSRYKTLREFLGGGLAKELNVTVEEERALLNSQVFEVSSSPSASDWAELLVFLRHHKAQD